MSKTTRLLLIILLLVAVVLIMIISCIIDAEKNELEKEVQFWKDAWTDEMSKHHDCQNNLTICKSSLAIIEEFLDADRDVHCYAAGAPSFVVMAKDVAMATDYVEDVYDCTQFSDDLMTKLRRYGWDVEKKLGYLDDELHEWVVVKDVPIEATGGWVIEPETYEERYEVLEDG